MWIQILPKEAIHQIKMQLLIQVPYYQVVKYMGRFLDCMYGFLEENLQHDMGMVFKPWLSLHTCFFLCLIDTTLIWFSFIYFNNIFNLFFEDLTHVYIMNLNQIYPPLFQYNYPPPRTPQDISLPISYPMY